MKRLTQLLAQRKGGVYRWQGKMVRANRRDATAPAIVSIDVPDTKQALLERLATDLALPEWFGHNWDALEDCLAELPQAEGRGVVIELRHLGGLAAHDPDSVRTLLDILRDAAVDWSVRGGFLLVLAEGAGRLAGDIEPAGE